MWSVALCIILPLVTDALALSSEVELRLGYSRLGELRADPQGRAYGQDYLLGQLFSWKPKVELDPALVVHGELQVLSGYLTLDPPDARFADIGARGENAQPLRSWGAFVDQVTLRQLYIEWKTPFGALIAGRVVSHWGLGLLAHGGAERPEWGDLRVGEDLGYGDIVNRVLLAVPALAYVLDTRWASRWLLAVGADLVERDERTQRTAGDLFTQGVVALRYSHKTTEGGVYVAQRAGRDRNREELDVLAYDAYAKGEWTNGEVRLGGSGEAAWVQGTTTLARNSCHSGPMPVNQLGYLGRLALGFVPWNVELEGELGYASGDSNPCDPYVRNFTFDPVFNPSLVLFEELRAAETTGSAANVSDPARVGAPPDSVRLLPTQGAVTNAIYGKGTLRWRWRDFGARAALLWAQSEEDQVDPYSLAVSGGDVRNFQGGPGNEHGLGWELDVGLDYTFTVSDLSIALSAQAGRLWPKAGFAGASSAHPKVDVAFFALSGRLGPVAK